MSGVVAVRGSTQGVRSSHLNVPVAYSSASERAAERRHAQDESMTALTPLAATYSFEALASRNAPLSPTGVPGEHAAVERGRTAPRTIPQHSSPPPESGDPHAPRRARPPARVIDRHSNNCSRCSDTHRSSTTDAMSRPQTQGAPPEYPVTCTYRQQLPHPRKYQ